MYCPALPVRLLLLLRLSARMYRANNPRGRYHRHIEGKAGLRSVDLQPEGSDALPPLLVKKIRWYMVELLETGRLLVLLREKPLTAREEKALILLGGIMAVYDSLVDDQDDPGLPGKVLERFIRKEWVADGSSQSAPEKVFRTLSECFYNTVSPEQWSELTRHFEQIRYQLRSGEQKNSRLGREEVLHITRGKGGASLLLCSSLLFPGEKSLETAFFELGALIQFLNDAQDLQRDAMKGIRTFVAFCSGFPEIQETLEYYRDQTFRSFLSSFSDRARLYPLLFSINAMVVVILYKIGIYSERCGQVLDLNKAAQNDKAVFRVNPFSMRSLTTNTGAILRFRLP